MPRLLHYSDIEGVYDDPDRLARLAGRIEDLRGPDALVVGTGDDTAPGVLPLVARGRQSVAFFEAVRPDAETFGNHDFDYGLDATRAVVRASPQRWLSANVRDGDRPFGHEEGVTASTVLETADARVGLVGVTDPLTREMSPRANGLTFEDPLAAVERELAALRGAGADYLVVLSHLGGMDDALAERVDVDAVLGGHLHVPRLERVAGTVCTRPGANGHAVVEVDLAAGTATRHAVDGATPDADLREYFETRRREAGLSQVVGHVERPIERTRSHRYDGESRIGNFVADAYRWATDADCALHNSGGIREGPPLAGDVTVADLASVVPFDGPVALARVTGAELRALCREAHSHAHGESRWLAHVSGLRVRYDRDASEVLDLRVGGELVDDDRTYRLATNAYLTVAAHEFPTLTPAHCVGSAAVQYEVLADYARATGIDPEREGRVELR
ncbi:bifunctional metallophosphatase/5'-nucleotidase [Halomarina ordinaria]|uniref:Bifunctional metallophosphatase/5'-nucleotidase n=1 Tax=Halomarina ordinaria TaxID=3033939 RepID=A0ABD5UB36_9EURY|nr:bifunctional metallophosphatase/5'-nucleotidase [Halomarina sp. PSRA2]